MKLCFVEPHPTGGDATVTLTEEQAIAWQRRIRYYASDADALNDFMVVNWAYWAYWIPSEKGEDE